MSDDGTDYAEVAATYAAQGIGGGSAGVGTRLAMLVIDFQHLYTRGRASTGLAAVERTAELLRLARARGTPIAFALVAYPETEQPRDHAWTRKCPGLLEARFGSQAATLDPLLAAREDEPVLVKQVPSALFDPLLREHFWGLGVDTLLVAGTSTSGCVRATVVDGVSHDFRMLVVRECVTDRSRPSAEAALFDIGTKYGDVIELSEATGLIEAQDAAVPFSHRAEASS